MTSRSLLRFAARVLAFVALVGSGTYVIVYLWRWEWNRALITGVLFLATLVVVSTWAVLASLRRIAERLEHLEGQAQSTTHVANTLRRASAGHATRHFDWLREPPDRLGVFVPILLGAGAVLSALAYVIERLAGAIGGPAVDRTTARLLTYDVPLGPSTSAPDLTQDRARPDETAAAGPPRGREIGRTAIAAGGLVVVVVGSVWMLREATQSRPDPLPRPARTEVELAFRQRSGLREPTELAVALWSACSQRLPSPRRVQLQRIEAGPTPDRAMLVLDHTVGTHARRRLVGCMEDVILDDVQADVLRIADGSAGG